MECCFTIPCPDHILWWLICICIIGVMISAAIMWQAGRFSLTRDGEQVSIQKLHLTRNADVLDTTLRRMSGASRKSLRSGLRGDFLFMPFFYTLLILVSLQLYLGYRPNNREPVLQVLCYVPFLTWLMDLVENFCMLGLLSSHAAGKKLSRPMVWIMAISSSVKWISGIGWLVMTISILLAWAVR